MSDPSNPSGVTDLSAVKQAAIQRELEKEQQDRARRLLAAYEWMRFMKRTFKGIQGGLTREEYATLAREKFDV